MAAQVCARMTARVCARWFPLALGVSLLLAGLACDQAQVRAGGGNGPATGGGQAGSGPARPPAGPGIALPDAGPGAGGAPVPGASGTMAPAPGDKCAADVHAAELVPLDLLLLVDSSGSMNEPAGQRSKWDTARSALEAFLKDQKSSGLGVGLQFFPYYAPAKACMTDADCGRMAPRPNFWCHVRSVCWAANSALAQSRSCDPGLPLCPSGTTCAPLGRCALSGADCIAIGDPCPGNIAGDLCMGEPKTCQEGNGNSPGSCTAADYEPLRVPIMGLPAAEPLLSAALAAKKAVGGTPMGPAAQGALAHLRKHVTANPGRRAVLVLVTDGLPQNCLSNDVAAVAATLAAERALTPAISTYVIGVFDPAALGGSQAALGQLATGGGTGMPFVLVANDDLTKNFIESLDQIRGAALACEFKIPAAMPGAGAIDHGKVNVRITAPGGNDDLLYVGRADRCDPMRGGWYYDVEPGAGQPTRVLTCPATCARLKDAQGGKDVKVELLFGCQSRVD